MRWFFLLVLILGQLPMASAKAGPVPDPSTILFDRATSSMDAPRRVQFCAYVADKAAELAAESGDSAIRASRAVAARQLLARLATELARANTSRSQEQLQAIEQENGEVMGLLSYAPSDLDRSQVEGGNTNDLLGVFVTDVVVRCNAMLDVMKVPPALAPDMSAITPAFTWRGATAETIFGRSSLVPIAARLCADEAATASDFAGTPLNERGEDNISLLDWAMECGDKASFGALLEAGFDATRPSLFGDLILVRAAARKDSFYLRTLLEQGVSPDAMGPSRTALAEAYDPLEGGGGENFKLLRAAGANLNFPSPDWSMWSVWSTYAHWEQILANWNEFDSDPVSMGRSVSMELERLNPRGGRAGLEQIKMLLASDHGVCFPIGALIDYSRDERAYYLQPECLKQPD